MDFDHTATTASGKPLEIISNAVVDSTAPKVLTEAVRQWLLERGFCEKERYGGLQIFFRDRHSTPLGTQEVIKLALPLDEDEIHELFVRFLLTEHTPDEIPQWRDFLAELGHEFGFQLMDEDHRLLPCIDFLLVLAENWNFRTFQNNYGWKI